MDLVRDTAAKIVRIHELEAENKRLRDSVKSISINNQDTEIHICEEAHLSTRGCTLGQCHTRSVTY
jgi:hypothetical protein